MNDIMYKDIADRKKKEREILALLGGKADNREEICNQAIRDLFKEPFMIDGQTVHTSPSISWARYPEDGTSIDQLISKADTRKVRGQSMGSRNSSFNNSPGLTAWP